MEQYTITEFSYAVIAMSGALSGVLLVIWKSRCVKLNLMWGCAKCDRSVLPPEVGYNRPVPPSSAQVAETQL
jgi:hypothetical protein